MAVHKEVVVQHGATQTQNCKIHAGLVSLFTDIFDCKKVMLEAGQPGELPLMRELTSLKRVRSLRDPSTGSNVVGGSSSALTPSWKSPVVGSMGKSREIRGDKTTVYNGKPSLKRGLAHSIASPFSDHIHAIERGRACWDLDMEQEETLIGLHMKHNPAIKPPKGDVFRQYKPTMNHREERLSLHNWRDPSWASDMEASFATSQSLQNQRGVQRRNNSFDFSARGRSGGHSRDVFELQNEALEDRRYTLKERAGRIKSQKKTLSGSKQCPQVLSPLVLNSLDDVHFQSNSLSVFSLEGNYHGRHDQPNRVAMKGLPKSDISLSQSPHLLKHVARMGQRDAAKSSWKSQHMLTSSTSTSQRTVSQSSMSGAWEATSNQLEDELDVCELPKNGCGIPCYWSKSQKRGKSLLDMAERGFSCGFYSKSPKVMARSSSKQYPSGSRGELGGYPGHEPVPQMGLEALPLLSDLSAASDDIMGSSADDSDRLSSDLNGELALDGSGTCHALRNAAHDTQDNVNGGKELAIYFERPRSLSQKYRPKVFEELVGQNLVAHALSNAVHMRKIAPVYLFQGSRGTGKTSAARIFAAALNCVTLEDQRPCGVCKECLAFTSGKSLDIREVDAASNNGVEKVKALLLTAFSAPSFSQFKVFIVDECHMLTNETWNALLKLLEEPPRNVVFILITTDPEKLPSTAVSRCQKFPFPKIKESEIVSRLQNLAKLENMDVEPGALDLVASRSDGSLRDAEIILDQLSLLGQKITVPTVHELFGSVSDEKLLGLLDLALCSDTVSTVQRARELIDSGVEPLDLMVQLATLITDILAGSNELMTKNQDGGFFSNQTLSEEELERLRFALRILSDAEKQLRAASNDRTTWLTAALLQFGPARPCAVSVSSSGTSATASPIVKTYSNDNRQVLKIINGRKEATNHKNMVKGLSSGCSQKKVHASMAVKNKSKSALSSFEVQVHPEDKSGLSSAASRDPSHAKVQSDLPVSNEKRATLVGPGNLEKIWCNVLERCKSLPIRQLLQSHGKLLAVSISADDAVVFLEFRNSEYKSRSERYKKSIANAFQAVLGLSVEVKMSLASIPRVTSSVGARVQAIVDQQAVSSQGHSKQNLNSMSQQHEQKCFEGGSLHYWRSRSRTASPRTLEHANSAQSFLAIPPFPNGTVADSHHTAERPSSTPHFGSGMKSFQRAEIALPERTRPGGAWNTEARLVPSLQSTQSTETIQEIVLENPADSVRSEHMIHDGAAAAAAAAIHCCKENANLHAYNLEEENLRLESQSKYGGLLCWRGPKVEDEEVSKQHHHRGCGILKRCVPCAKSER